ncbi:MAG: LacI family transcriptional regulator [Segetibacter sp.]|jgi:LacI family transcriptional regulator|nr:LacI family transcriptional regulator [Segetibacter sp.]
MKKKTSLKDIAQKVGVSTALVSYVLNNKKEGRISKQIAEKIRATAIELNYKTNQIARSLKTNKTYTIGLVVADIANAFSSTLARIIEDEAEKNNYTVLFGSSDENAQKSEKLINVLLDRQVDGLIIAPVEDTASQIVQLQENEVPFVLIDRYFPDMKTNYVAMDNYKAAHAAVSHLINGGNKRIGLVTFKTTIFNIVERKRGYVTALKEYKTSAKRSWIREVSIQNAQEEVREAIDQLLSLSEPVDAILFSSNLLSTYALKYLNTLPVKVPDQLNIVTIDQSDASDTFYAPLTYIRQPLLEMGQLATKILLESISKNNKITQVNLEPELVVGKSTSKV